MIINLNDIPVFYINLDDEDEKRKSTESLLKRSGFKSVTRVPAILHPKGRIVGCARSHYEILRNQKPPFIILEDDCELNRPIFNYLEIPDSSDALYLGNSQWGRFLNHSGPYVHYQKIDDLIIRVYNMLATHSILYLSDVYVEVCKRIAYHCGYEVEEHLDIGFAEVHKLFNVYALDIPLFRQYDWSNVTSGSLSERALNKEQADTLFDKVLSSTENYYRLNEQFKSPIRPLLELRDASNVPGYYLPTRLV